MALTLRLTSDMDAKEMQPHWADIVECLNRYVRRFPDDETIPNILRKCAEGKRQLWIVTDENARVVLVPITEIVTVDATGKTRLVMCEVGGFRIVEALPLYHEIEKWAVENHGVTEVDWVGRKGWAKMIEPMGFTTQAVIWRKRIDQ